jgi:hypothetical protein
MKPSQGRAQLLIILKNLGYFFRTAWSHCFQANFPSLHHSAPFGLTVKSSW